MNSAIAVFFTKELVNLRTKDTHMYTFIFMYIILKDLEHNAKMNSL